MKSKKYIKKKKGVRYIAKALVRYQKKKYKNYFQALPDARKFYENIKSSGESVKLSTIWKYSRTHRERKIEVTPVETPPKLSEELLSVVNYWGLINYPRLILQTTNEIFFVSQLFNEETEEIQGGNLVDYDDSFSNYVNHINRIVAINKNINPIDGEYPGSHITCLPIYKNEIKNRWETEIIEVNSDGTIPNDEESYGYDKNNIETVDFEPKPIKELKKIKFTELPKKIIPKQATTAKIKAVQNLISDLRKDVAAGLIPKEDYLKMVKGLYNMLNPNI